MYQKIPCGILGTGTVGMDLLMKILRSKYLECVVFAGQREDSPGIAKAKSLGIKTATDSINAILESDAQIVFDATTAEAHRQNASKLKDRFILDLTPAKVGYMCVPSINLKEAITKPNVNLISCGSQAAFPLIAKIKNLEYVELVTTIASKSAGMGTRENIDEYIETTTKALEKFFKCKAKAILIINPAEPPVMMHSTIYAKVKDKDEPIVIQQYKEGCGDFLPTYAGNLDAINVAAITVAEAYAKNNRFNFKGW